MWFINQLITGGAHPVGFGAHFETKPIVIDRKHGECTEECEAYRNSDQAKEIFTTLFSAW